MSNNKRRLILVGYTLLIFISLPWVRQLWDIAGKRNSYILLAALFTLSLGFIAVRLRNVILIGISAMIVAAIFKFVNLPIERIHFIEYGILGWLAYWAMGKKAVFYVIVISVLDEIVQGILPNRYFGFRDICMNLMGGGIGIWLYTYERYL